MRALASIASLETIARSSTGRTASHADRGSTEIRRKTSEEGAVQMREAKDAAALQAGPSLEQIHAAAALIAISGEVGVAEHSEDAEFRHLRCAAEMGQVGSNVSRRR
jgi:hypothetical protein